MIVGVFLRYIKSYRGIGFIPLSDGEKFCGILGNNGVGKSSILEALDCFFNGKQWNINVNAKKRDEPYIVPVFLIETNKIRHDLVDIAKAISEFFMNIKEDQINSSNKENFKKFSDLRARIKHKVESGENYFIPIGCNYSSDKNSYPEFAIFENQTIIKHIINFFRQKEEEIVSNHKDENSIKSSIGKLLEFIKTMFKYVYIPKEINPELFTKLETNELQTIMGKTLGEIIRQSFSGNQLKKLNKDLNNHIESLNDNLGEYSYRNLTAKRIVNLKNEDIKNLIIGSFFSRRTLHKEQATNYIEISKLSSGEKQKAIIDVAYKLLCNNQGGGKNLIIGLDEPESSLHMSACFSQFDKLYKMSSHCHQLLFSSHWYGFLPTTESGSVSALEYRDGTSVNVNLISLSNYREQLKNLSSQYRNDLPINIQIKSTNDFVQSVISSSLGDEPYNWLICEGSSDKIYLNFYLKEIIEAKKLRIIPVGGARAVKSFYNNFVVPYEEYKKQITGVTVLLSDTDSQLVRYETLSFDKMKCKRIANDDSCKCTTLVDISGNPVSPKTDIEDVLCGDTFFKVLSKISKEENDALSFIDSITPIPELNSYYALDLRQSERNEIEKFIDRKGMKFRIANEYVKIAKENPDHNTPPWINELIGYYGTAD